jgi:hypothetical protein
MSRLLKKRNSNTILLKYAVALRCIGQELERRGLKSFDIRFEANEFVARCGYQNPPSPMPVTIQYTNKDVMELDQVQFAKRGESLASKDFLNQAQIFRAIGGYLDNKEAHLVRLTNNAGEGTDSLFKVEYISCDGERVIEDRAGAALYDMCVAMYKQRGKMTGTEGPLSRWRP